MDTLKWVFVGIGLFLFVLIILGFAYWFMYSGADTNKEEGGVQDNDVVPPAIYPANPYSNANNANPYSNANASNSSSSSPVSANAPINAYSSSSSSPVSANVPVNNPTNNAIADEKEKSFSVFSFLSQASNKDVVPVEPHAPVAPAAPVAPVAPAASAIPVAASAAAVAPAAAPYISSIINVDKSISAIPSPIVKEVGK